MRLVLHTQHGTVLLGTSRGFHLALSSIIIIVQLTHVPVNVSKIYEEQMKLEQLLRYRT
jgi:hypothetical protein